MTTTTASVVPVSGVRTFRERDDKITQDPETRWHVDADGTVTYSVSGGPRRPSKHTPEHIAVFRTTWMVEVKPVVALRDDDPPAIVLNTDAGAWTWEGNVRGGAGTHVYFHPVYDREGKWRNAPMAWATRQEPARSVPVPHGTPFTAQALAELVEFQLSTYGVPTWL